MNLTIEKRAFLFRNKFFKAVYQSALAFRLYTLAIWIGARIGPYTIFIIKLNPFEIGVDFVKVGSLDFEEREQIFTLNKKYVSIVKVEVLEVFAFLLRKYHDLLMLDKALYQLVLGRL